MVSPKPESYHDALYHLAVAAESSPSPQPGHYGDQQHYQPYHHLHHQQQHHDPAQHHHSQGRHYVNMPPTHRPHNQYRYSDRSYSPATASVPSTSSVSHHADASASRLPPPSAHADLAQPKRPPTSHPSDRSDDPGAGPSDAAAVNAVSAAAGEKKISCMECRLSKVKCSGGDLCTRCKRLGKECYYKSHKRGRKSDSSKIQKLERTVETLSRTLEQFSKNKVASSPSSSWVPAKSVQIDTKHTVRSQAVNDQDAASSPEASWKGAEVSRPSAPSSSSAMSPPAQSPRATVGSAYRDSASHKPRQPSELYRQRSTSSSWQTPKSIISATPTSDDPDEPENLGLPTLSNPLKLLAHASDSERDRDSGLATESSITTSRSKVAISTTTDRSEGTDKATSNGAATTSADQRPSSSSGDNANTDKSGRASLFGVYPGTTAPNTVSRFGPGRGKAFFDVGLFNTKLDNLPHFDPIDRGYLTLAEAESLYALYMQHINPMITLLDPHLHTFDYVRSCSALLLSSTCWIAAKYRVEASQIAADLEMHIRSNLLPTILMEGFRNAEIPQALIILAAYHPQMNTLSEDKAWAYVGFAIRIASELDMNSKIAVRPANRQDDEFLARRLRNRERTWLNLWLFETSMSQHMGRRPTLANDPVVMGCAHWHLDKFALPADKAVVAVVQLRLLMLRNIELFENFVDASITHLPAERTAKQIELFRRICASDLDTWLATWTSPSHHLPKNSTPSSSSTSEKRETKAMLWPNTDLPPTLSRIHRLKLYYWYARLILDTIALKCSHLGLAVLRPIYKDAYACCMAYLGLFVATMVPNGLFWGHNSTVVTPVYCGIFALRIVGLISTSAGAASLQVKSQPKRAPASTAAAAVEMADGSASGKKQQQQEREEEELGINIDAEYTFEMVEKVAKVCEEAGNATPHRRGAAGSYAFFLFTVLGKARGAWRAKLAKREAEAEAEGGTKVGGGGGKKRNREATDAANGGGGRLGKAAKNDKLDSKIVDTGKDGSTTTGNASTEGNGSVPNRSAAEGQAGEDRTSSTAGEATFTGDEDQHHHFLRQLMQFQAGPSGVQTAILPNHPPSSISHQPLPPQPYPTQLMPTSSGMIPIDSNLSTLTASNAASAALGEGIAGSGLGVNGESGGGVHGGESGGGGEMGGVDIDWDFGMLDGFLGESLFSDMSFISAATPGSSGVHTNNGAN